ncbi:hypothetical protein [Haloechinothrix halophila]|uniref:hypothetical protein n=1 Tax=Haloechinothrix halophila TaxID=1069073 RepID=UPI00041F9E74|nr:hypothetical protein [Haloechinothrix halophila]
MTEEAAAQARGKTVYLHIGTPKSGTTYLQGALKRNKERLAARGVLWPGRNWGDQVFAVRDLANMHPHNHRPADVAGAWQRLVDEIHAWQGHSAIVSMEWLVGAKPQQIRRAVETLAPAEVSVVLTGRDLARTIPADWQEAMQNWDTYSWDEYLAALVDPELADAPPARRLWRQQDLGAILSRWNEVVPAARTHVITVPPPGTHPHVLWQRFAAVLGIDPDDYDTAAKGGNTSLGVVSAELMRNINVRAREAGLSWKANEKLLKHVLAKQVLTKRSGLEPALALPAEHYPWTIEHGKRIVSDVENAGVRVWGDLDELIPDPAHAREGTTPDAISDRDLLDAALDGIVGLVGDVNGKLAAQQPGRGAARAQPAGAEQALQKLPTRDLVKRFLVELASRVGWLGTLHRGWRALRRRNQPTDR